MSKNFKLYYKGELVEGGREVLRHRVQNDGETYGVVRFYGKDRVVRYDENTGKKYIAEEAIYH